MTRFERFLVGAVIVLAAAVVALGYLNYKLAVQFDTAIEALIEWEMI